MNKTYVIWGDRPSSFVLWPAGVGELGVVVSKYRDEPADDWVIVFLVDVAASALFRVIYLHRNEFGELMKKMGEEGADGATDAGFGVIGSTMMRSGHLPEDPPEPPGGVISPEATASIVAAASDVAEVKQTFFDDEPAV